MLNISQMRRLTGVSRRTLQDYDELGLLRHRSTTPGGYWLYDEEDAVRLSVIQMLHSSGYTRREIRDMIGGPDVPFCQMLDRIMTALEQRRMQLDSLLAHMGQLRQQTSCPAAEPEDDATI